MRGQGEKTAEQTILLATRKNAFKNQSSQQNSFKTKKDKASIKQTQIKPATKLSTKKQIKKTGAKKVTSKQNQIKKTESDIHNMLKAKNIVLPEQTFFHKTKFDANKIEYEYNGEHWKPHGGLWTSEKENWTEFMFYDEEDKKPKGYLTTIKPCKARVLVLETLEQQLLFQKQFPRDTKEENIEEENYYEFSPFGPSIDWQKASENYDAIHLTASGLYEANKAFGTEQKSPFYGWDIPSTFWFKPKFDVVEQIKQ